LNLTLNPSPFFRTAGFHARHELVADGKDPNTPTEQLGWGVADGNGKSKLRANSGFSIISANQAENIIPFLTISPLHRWV
jgi:hypothetical protein